MKGLYVITKLHVNVITLFCFVVAITLASVNGSTVQEMQYLQLQLLRRVLEKYSYMMVEEIISHFTFLTNFIPPLLLRSD